MKKYSILLQQAWPIFISQLAVTLYGVIDTIFASQLSPKALVVVSVSTNIYTTVYITFSSILYILLPYISQFFGEKNNTEVVRTISNGIWLALLLCVPVVLFLAFPGAFLLIANLSSEHALSVRHYLNITIASVPAIFLFRVYFAYCVSTLKPTLVMYLNFIGLFIKVVLSWLLIHGVAGMPKMGIYGCAISTVIMSWVILIIAFFLLKKDVDYGDVLFHKIFSFFDLKYMLELLSKGFPIGLTFFIDFTALTFIGLLVARMGDIITGSYQIASSLSLLCYLIPLSIGSAASVLIAKSTGERDFHKSAEVRSTSLSMTSIISLSICVVLVLMPEQLASFYTGNPGLIKTSAGLIKLVAAYHFFDALLTVTNGLLRGYKKTSFPAVIYGFSLWLFGLGGGYYLAFKKGLGVDGFWYGLTFAAFVAMLFMALYLYNVEKMNHDAITQGALHHENN